MRDGFTLGDWVNFLARKGNFPPSAAESIERDMESYAEALISYDELACRVTEKYAEGLCGEPRGPVVQAADEFVSADKRLFDYVRPLVNLLKAHGVSLVLVSGCPHEPLAAYRRTLPIDDIYALTVGTVNRLYTNKLLLNPALGDEKARIVGVLAKNANIILALGDSRADLPLLEAAPHNIIVDNPDLVPKGDRVIHRVSPRSDSGDVANLRDIVHQAIQGLWPWVLRA